MVNEMKAAKINNNDVVDVIKVNSHDLSDIPEGYLACDVTVSIGWRHDGTKFYKPSIYEGMDNIDIFNKKIEDISANTNFMLQSIAKPYPAGERETWFIQSSEAQAWTTDNTYVPELLNAMVSASNGGWTLSDLSTHILTNSSEFKSASGDILGQKKALTDSLKTIYDGIGTTHTRQDLIDFDCSVTMPVINLEDKF